MRLLLSYFDDYFSPHQAAALENRSAGQIARHLYEAMAALGNVETIDTSDRPNGRDDDVFVGHFWSFAQQVRPNAFGTNVVVYSLCDPTERRRLTAPLEEWTGLKEPANDLPPDGFDHDATLHAADLILLVGNEWTRNTFAPQWRPKIRLVNYSVDARHIFASEPGPSANDPLTASDPVPRNNEVCYVATQCGLRKGFLDVLETWRTIDPRIARLHCIGAIDDEWSRMLMAQNVGNIVHHGWIDSREPRYGALLRRCRFAHIPTLAEGQMGTLLDAIFSGCIPITTRASGIDDRVLEHCIVVESRDIEGQRQAILDALGWSDEVYAARRRRMLDAARLHHSWESFHQRVTVVLQEAVALTRERV